MMSWRTNPLTIIVRNIGRSLGLNKLIENLLSSSEYEDTFKKSMVDSIRPNDCVWDIGANVGFYTLIFSEIVGVRGSVYSFEPSELNLKLLRDNTQGQSNINIHPIALGDRDSLVAFHQGEDSLGATSKIIEGSNDSGGIHKQVKLTRGDKIIEDGLASIPNFIKIDTEGYELDVLTGLENTLKNPIVRIICVEVHFRLLNERGMPDAPARIESLLKSCGFHLNWPDASHIIAIRD